MNILKKYKFAAVLAVVAGFGMTSCDDFLNRPTEDGYTTEDYYKSDQECYNGVNHLYGLPWSDLTAAYFSELENAAGNQYAGGNAFVLLSIQSNNQSLKEMVGANWRAIAEANITYNKIKGASASEAAKNATMGEALTWKAFAYFNLVRMLGPIPIIHDTESDISSGAYNSKFRVESADVYEYVIMTLEKAVSLLPESAAGGRIDRFSAKALLAKVYLAKSGLGQTGTRNQADLDMAASLAKDVMDNSGRELMENYEDIFRASNNFNKESLLAWHWYGSYNPYGCGNQLQAIFAMGGFTNTLTWGDWTVPSVDLQEAFGLDIFQNPEERRNTDVRRKATMMIAGDKYSYFWRNVGGFDYLKFLYDKEYNPDAKESLSSGTGANVVKGLVGNDEDHKAELGYIGMKQSTGLSTHLIRLADVYLIYVEAKIGNNASSTEASVIDAFHAVHHRAVSADWEKPSSVSWEDVWKERRLELAYEGDRWFDFVRLSYYDPQRAINELKSQKRSYYNGLDELYKTYWETGKWTVKPESMQYDTNPPVISVTESVFRFPMPEDDVIFNPNLSKEPIHVDVRAEYAY
ncbi:RagB/SusD family nutrient uptake outer membrane protein [Heminiphilus faecis]|uniref:RagB/SusD family nutrient uptake outer membrane protein n=1 Tax=Heminiphilus faecis TaxID=2601703 RepID=A0ABV4CUB9_9BACT